MTVEFIGLPGVGKTVLHRKIRKEQLLRSGFVIYNIHTSQRENPYIRFISNHYILELLLISANSLYILLKLFIKIPFNQRLLVCQDFKYFYKRLLYRLSKRSIRGYWLSKGEKIINIDSGLLQVVLEYFIHYYPSKMVVTLKNILSIIPVPEYLIFIDNDNPELVAERVLKRPCRRFFINVQNNELIEKYQHANLFLEDLIELIQQRGSRVIIINNENLEHAAARLNYEINQIIIANENDRH